MAELEPIYPGYRVRIACLCPTWSGWVPNMNVCLGRDGVVGETNFDYCRVVIPGEHSWNFPFTSLDILDRAGIPPGHGPNNQHLSQELPQ